jgi:hypothetical protein
MHLRPAELLFLLVQVHLYESGTPGFELGDFAGKLKAHNANSFLQLISPSEVSFLPEPGTHERGTGRADAEDECSHHSRR